MKTCTKPIGITLTERELEMIKTLREEEGFNLSGSVRAWIRNYYKKTRQKK